MSSSQGNTSGAAKDLVQSPGDMSSPTSPTDSRHPLARVELIDQQLSQPDEGLSEDFQSTDTVRRRPEPQSYGMHSFMFRGISKSRTDLLYRYYCVSGYTSTIRA